MDLTTPAAAIVPSVRARVLTVLARTEAGLTGRRIAGLAGGSVAGVAKILESLVSGGLVHRVDAGSANLYALNHDHVGASAVLSMANMRDELFFRMRRNLGEFTFPPLTAILFGSAARGEGDNQSDIDVLLVRPASVEEDDEVWSRDVSQLAERVLAWTGNTFNVVEYSPGELRARAVRRRAFLTRVQEEGILLHGTALARPNRHTLVVRA